MELKRSGNESAYNEPTPNYRCECPDACHLMQQTSKSWCHCYPVNANLEVRANVKVRQSLNRVSDHMIVPDIEHNHHHLVEATHLAWCEHRTSDNAIFILWMQIGSEHTTSTSHLPTHLTTEVPPMKMLLNSKLLNWIQQHNTSVMKSVLYRCRHHGIRNSILSSDKKTLQKSSCDVYQRKCCCTASSSIGYISTTLECTVTTLYLLHMCFQILHECVIGMLWVHLFLCQCCALHIWSLQKYLDSSLSSDATKI